MSDGMSSLESLSKDDIPLGLVIKYIRSRMHHKIMFGQKTTPLHRLKNLKTEEWLPLRVRVKAAYSDNLVRSATFQQKKRYPTTGKRRILDSFSICEYAFA